MGAGRNLASFAAAQGVSRQSIYETARRYRWKERALAWDMAEAAAGRCPPPPPPAPKQRPPARPQAPQEPPQPEAPNLLNTMAAELTDQEHQIQEAKEFVEAFRKVGRGFVLQSEQVLQLLQVMQNGFRLQLDRHRQLMEEKEYQAAADLARLMNNNASMIVLFSTAASALAASGRLHWGDSVALLELIQKGYGEGV